MPTDAPTEQPFIAYELHQLVDYPLEAAPINREWMDKAHLRFPYRCLPLTIANQAGWVIRSPIGFAVYWYGGSNKEDVEIRFDGQPDPRVCSHFGVGTFTFTIPFLFRTPPGINLWVKGPTNWIKDGAQPLEGIVETDWLASTFTMNWKLTRVCEWVRFERGDPFCMLVPVPRGLAESLVPRRERIESAPELKAEYDAWQASRNTFLHGLHTRDPQAVKLGWQKDYFQGRRQGGEGFDEHQTKLAIREFTPAPPPPPVSLPPPTADDQAGPY
ncbi:MAG: DUF6065 family protein [Gemmataceae bacterium]